MDPELTATDASHENHRQDLAYEQDPGDSSWPFELRGRCRADDREAIDRARRAPANPNAAYAAAPTTSSTTSSILSVRTVLAGGLAERTTVAAIATVVIAYPTVGGGCRAGAVHTGRTRNRERAACASSTAVCAQRTGRFDVNRISVEQDGASAAAGTSARIAERRRAATSTRGLQRSAHIDRPPSGHLERPTASTRAAPD